MTEVLVTVGAMRHAKLQ